MSTEQESIPEGCYHCGETSRYICECSITWCHKCNEIEKYFLPLDDDKIVLLDICLICEKFDHPQNNPDTIRDRKCEGCKIKYYGRAYKCGECLHLKCAKCTTSNWVSRTTNCVCIDCHFD